MKLSENEKLCRERPEAMMRRSVSNPRAGCDVSVYARVAFARFVWAGSISNLLMYLLLWLWCLFPDNSKPNPCKHLPKGSCMELWRQSSCTVFNGAAPASLYMRLTWSSLFTGFEVSRSYYRFLQVVPLRVQCTQIRSIYNGFCTSNLNYGSGYILYVWVLGYCTLD